MSHLVPCPGCTRHVRVSESLCPFCATALPESVRTQPARALPPGRLSRAATYAIGAARTKGLVVAAGAALAAATASCSAPVYGGPPDGSIRTDSGTDSAVASDAGSDGGSAADLGTPADLGTDTGILAMYGGPPPVDAGSDSGPAGAYGGPPPDAGFDAGAPAADYGSPPA